MKTRVNINIDPDILYDMDNCAETMKMNRSEFIEFLFQYAYKSDLFNIVDVHYEGIDSSEGYYPTPGKLALDTADLMSHEEYTRDAFMTVSDRW